MIKIIFAIFITLFLLGCEGEEASLSDIDSGSIYRLDGTEITGPTAKAGADQTVVEGDTVTLDANASSDSDGTIESYSWVNEDGSVLSTESSFSKTDLPIGSYTVILTVTDNDGVTDSDTVIVTVSRNRLPTADAGIDQSVKVGETLDLDASASSDSDGDIVSYEWKVKDTLLSTESSFSISSLLAGEYTITLTVTDNKGATSTDNISVTIKGNEAPTADAGVDQEIRPGETVNFDASGSSDSDGTIVNYEWKEGNTVISTNPSFSLSTLSTTTHTFTLTVTDDYGATDTDTMLVTVALSITHNGTTYNKITSPYTGKIWLDRNIGASRVCTSYNDTECYGDYYQWGRDADGHEKSTSSTTSTQASSITYAGSRFITSSSTYSNDWASSADSGGSLRSWNWSKTDGSFICPVGYRVPTVTELEAETTKSSNAVSNRLDAFNNFLKLPAAGLRSLSGDLLAQGTESYYWTTTYSSTKSTRIYFGSTTTTTVLHDRAYGRSIRCIKD